MIIAVIKELTPGEKRVALTPEETAKLTALGLSVLIEKGAGSAAGFADEKYLASGAEIVPSAKDACKNADIILKIWAPLPEEDKLFKAGQTIIANFRALSNLKRIQKFAEMKLQCFALDLLPRISRAQSMDILSSQSNLAGYKAVLAAADYSTKAVPMMITAAGTVAPAKVLVLGAGVAGLQAIATAKRLGAQVWASDVRPQVKEQVESLGGRFLEIAAQESFETTGGYAKETSENYKQQQQKAIAEQLKKTDIVITTALIPGKAAPILITAEMLKNLPAGGIIIDMAAENGGNVEGTQNNKTIETNGITIIGNSNLAAEVPFSASRLFSGNIFNFIAPMYDAAQKNIIFNYADELINSTCICKDGNLTGVIK